MDTTTTIDLKQLRERLREHGIAPGRLAVEADLYAGDIYSLFAGREKLGPVRARKIAEAMHRLGLDEGAS